MAGDSLFERTNSGAQPLAARMRPRTLDEFAGQDHILGPGRLLRRSIQADMLSSLIFYGPPGTGKTTLARVIANTTRSDFISLNAVLSGVKDVRESIEKARANLDYHDRRTILFVDEVHRWNKAQQDALLPWVENGTVVLIGATTHNPFFEVNSALVSRSRIFQLTPLTDDDLRMIVRNVITDRERGYGRLAVEIEDAALDHLISVSNGDARALLGALQLAVETTPDVYPPPDGTVIHVDRAVAEDSIQKKAVLYDKEGDYHFDVISAFIKSIRCSDSDSSLYWMAKMVHSGEDPRFIFRRMLISASEDIGLADPAALGVVEAAVAAFERVGMPEGRFFLAQAALYLATCPKSNSALGFFDAIEAIENEKTGDVPNHLRDANRDKEGFGHGEGYLYPHAFRDHWVAQAYLPTSLHGRIFYQPGDQGYESAVRDRVLQYRELQLELGAGSDETTEVLSYSRDADRHLDRWLSRTERGTAALAEMRDRVVDLARIERHSRVLVCGNAPTLVLWSALRKAPEGLVCAYFCEANRAEIARHHARQASPLLAPVITSKDMGSLPEFLADMTAVDGQLTNVKFDRMLISEPARLVDDVRELPSLLLSVAAEGALLVLSHRSRQDGMRLSEVVSLRDAESSALREAETRLYTEVNLESRTLEPDEMAKVFRNSAWTVMSSGPVDVFDQRLIPPRVLEEWFNAERQGLGSTILDLAGAEMLASIRVSVSAALADREVTWRQRSVVTVVRAAEG